MDPRHGAWLSQDPLGYVDSPNLYAYAAQNPTRLMSIRAVWEQEKEMALQTVMEGVFGWFSDQIDWLKDKGEDALDVGKKDITMGKGSTRKIQVGSS